MAAETENLNNVSSPGSKKKGILRHFRFRKNRGTTEDAAVSKLESARNESPTTLEDNADSPTPFENQKDPITSNKNTCQMRAVRFPVKDALKKPSGRSRRELTKPPPAREAAFGGPPRYDWIDIETSAAIKVQSVFRRNKTMKELERQGITTAAIRNQSRRRQARMNNTGLSGSADVPSLLACCGVGLAFGDATEEDFQATRQHEREAYLERQKEKEAREQELRMQFLKLSAKKKAAARRDDVEEVYEVIEE